MLSEESGVHGDGARGWILDPIDGTFNLVRGHRHWGTHVALEIDGVIAVGRDHAAAARRPVVRDARWRCLPGGRRRHAAATRGARRVRTWRRRRSGCGTTTPTHAARIRGATVWTDADMNDILGVAEGRCDAVVGSPGEIWDHAPNQLLVEEAGGRFRDDRGGHRIDVGRAHYSNGVIDEALAALLA